MLLDFSGIIGDKMFERLKYIFSSSNPYYKKVPYKFPSIKMIWCRIKNHPYNVVWFNVGGLEPDMRCQNCREDLG